LADSSGGPLEVIGCDCLLIRPRVEREGASARANSCRKPFQESYTSQSSRPHRLLAQRMGHPPPPYCEERVADAPARRRCHTLLTFGRPQPSSTTSNPVKRARRRVSSMWLP
jgi:hypothetical protein